MWVCGFLQLNFVTKYQYLHCISCHHGKSHKIKLQSEFFVSLALITGLVLFVNDTSTLIHSVIFMCQFVSFYSIILCLELSYYGGYKKKKKNQMNFESCFRWRTTHQLARCAMLNDRLSSYGMKSMQRMYINV